MRKFSIAAAAIAALLVAIGALSGAATGKTDAGGPKVPPPVTIQILNVSDWHGNVDPFGTRRSVVPGTSRPAGSRIARRFRR